MYAKVLNKNGKIYFTPVLVLNYKGWSSWFVVFDETYTKLIKANYWNYSRQQIQLIDNDLNGYRIIEKNLISIWDSKKLKLCKKGKFNSILVEEAKKYIKNYNPQEYIDIKTESDCKLFNDASMGCHDGYVLCSKHIDDGQEFLINTTWGSYVRIKAVGNVETNLNDSMIFYEVNPSIDNGKTSIEFICMSDESGFLSANTISFKTYFEDKIKMNSSIKFELKDNYIDIYNGKRKTSINYFNKIIHFFKEDHAANLFFENEDKIINVFIEKYNSSVEQLLEKLKADGFLINEVDNFNIVDSSTELGEIKYCSKNTVFPIKMFLIPCSWWIIVWLVVQLANPQMKWMFFFIMGIAPCLVLFLLFVLIFAFKGRNNSFIYVCDEGIVVSGFYKHRAIKYETIKEIKNGNRILILADKEFKLPKTKDKNELYDEINRNYELFKSNNKN